MEKYLEAVKEKVCAICCDSTADGICTLSKKERCAVEQFLPEIITIVNSIDSDDIFDYYQELKAKVCSACQAEDEDGNCYLRDDVNCSLDRYFPLIVETVKDVSNGAY